MLSAPFFTEWPHDLGDDYSLMAARAPAHAAAPVAWMA